MTDIRACSVEKRFGDVQAVHALDLHVTTGEFFAILGPSGSGKSTVLSLIAGLARPDAGQLSIGGNDVTALPARKRNIGLVFQNYALFPHLSVRENVAFPLRIRSCPAADIAKRVDAALDLVRLPAMGDRKPAELSGGQQQRVALARAIVFEPDILLLDEPLAALDRQLRDELQVELKHIQRSLGITTVLVTHDQQEALSLADRVMILQAGRVQQVAAPQEVYLRPANRFVAGFLGQANFFPDGAVEMMVRPESIVLDRNGPGIPARISDATFLGESTRYHLTFEDGRTAIAAPPLARHQNFRQNDTVFVAWDSSDAWRVPL